MRQPTSMLRSTGGVGKGKSGCPNAKAPVLACLLTLIKHTDFSGPVFLIIEPEET